MSSPGTATGASLLVIVVRVNGDGRDEWVSVGEEELEGSGFQIRDPYIKHLCLWPELCPEGNNIKYFAHPPT